MSILVHTVASMSMTASMPSMSMNKIRNCRCTSGRLFSHREGHCAASLTIVAVDQTAGQKSIGIGGRLSWSREGRE